MKPIYTVNYPQYMPAPGKSAFHATIATSLTLARRLARNAVCICDLRSASGQRIGYLIPSEWVTLDAVMACVLTPAEVANA